MFVDVVCAWEAESRPHAGGGKPVKYLCAKLAVIGSVLSSGSAYAASCTPNGNSFIPQAIAESGLSSLNAGFFGINNAYLGSPDSPKADQLGGGGWIRTSTGSFNTKGTSTSTVGGFCNPFLAQVKTKSDYTGVQAGFDLGRYNLSGNGASVNFGVTGGYVSIDSSTPDVAGDKAKQSFSVPFVGVYGAYKDGPFSIDLLVRHDFIDSTTNYALTNTVVPVPQYIHATRGGESTTISSSAAYHYDVKGMFFIEPSVGVSFSGISPLKLSSPGTLGNGNVELVLKSSSSNLGRATVRVGKDYVIGNYIIEPFAAVSVWNEFASDLHYYQLLNPGPSPTVIVAGTSNRIGTWEQYSLGSSLKIAGTAFSGFVRGDLRAGDRVNGLAFTGGVRYQF